MNPNQIVGEKVQIEPRFSPAPRRALERRVRGEVARVQPGFRRHEMAAVLEVADPLPGLQYGIYWIPPT
jgi:hypothetical protein